MNGWIEPRAWKRAAEWHDGVIAGLPRTERHRPAFAPPTAAQPTSRWFGKVGNSRLVGRRCYGGRPSWWGVDVLTLFVNSQHFDRSRLSSVDHLCILNSFCLRTGMYTFLHVTSLDLNCNCFHTVQVERLYIIVYLKK